MKIYFLPWQNSLQFYFQIIDLLFLRKTQGVSGERVNTLGGGSMDYFE
jgi:hypothetical protein